MNLGVITRLLIPTHLRFLLSQMPKPNFLKQSKHIVFKEGMINDRLSFLLIELSLDQQRTLQQPLPDVIKWRLAGVLRHEVVPFLESVEVLLGFGGGPDVA